MRNRNIVCRLYSLTLIFALLNTGFSAIAQTRRGQTSASGQTKQAAAKCSGAWTGVVTYTRMQSMSDNKTVQRVSGRGQDTRSWQMSYNYRATVSVVEAPERNGSSIGRASINHSFSSEEKISAVERNSCDQGKTWRDMRGESSSKTETSGSASGLEANVTVGVNADGTYTVSVGLPSIPGRTTGAQSSSYSGQCTPKEGKTFNLPPTETTIDGNSLTSDGTHRVNPADPNRISGSNSRSFQNVVETISWNLEKCGAPLRLIDLKFEDMKFPNWNDWQEIAEQRGTIDGNLIRIKAKVLNASGETKYADVRFKETYKGDKWDGSRPDVPLEDNVISVRLDAGEEREVEMVWDSSGYAWFDDGRPRLVQRIRAELEENGKKIDEMTRNLKIAPKPVVLVHGLWSNWKAWESWQNILTTAHSYDWKAYPVGERPEKGVMNTGGAFLSTDPTNSIFENSQQLGKYIRYAQEDRNAWHVDIVAHSMGGLISRHYIHNFMPANPPDGRPQIAHLVMLGTPNMGSPCADVMNFAFEAAGKNVEAVRQLRPSVVEEFNRVNTNRKGVKFSVLAGNPLPVICKTVVWNDGVVAVPSAVWQIKDHALSSNVHTELTGTKDFSSFVKPRLAVGPKGNHQPEAPELPAYPNQISRAGSDANFINAAYRPQAAETTRNFGFSSPLPGSGLYKIQNPQSEIANPNSDAGRPDFAKAVRLGPKQTIEVEIPVEAAPNFGLTFMADPLVSATLFDDRGAAAGRNLAKTPEAGAWFRSIFVERGVAAGTWKLKLENTAERDVEVILATWKNAVK